MHPPASGRAGGSFVDRELDRRHSDLLFEIPLRGTVTAQGRQRRRAFLYLLFEHQSTCPLLMLFRLLRYMLKIWEIWLRKHPDARKLPPILPVVLYHGKTTWTAGKQFSELYDMAPEDLAVLAPYLPDFKMVLQDLSHVDEEELKGEVLGRLALLLMKNIRRKDLLPFLERWLKLFAEVLAGPGWDSLRLVLQYMFEAGDEVQPEQLIRLVEQFESNVGTAREEVMTLAERLRREGRLEGRQEGRKEEAASILLRLLRIRFLEIPRELEARVLQASLEELERWTERILTAPTLHAVFTG